MDLSAIPEENHPAMDQILGYLNFSSGAADTTLLSNLNEVFRLVIDTEGAAWRRVVELLTARLDQLEQGSSTFRDAGQARAILELAESHIVACYFEFHQDLLFHQTESVVNAFFLGRIFEAILRQGAPWTETDRICDGAIAQLNDYIGYRPVATPRIAKDRALRARMGAPCPTLHPRRHRRRWDRTKKSFARRSGCWRQPSLTSCEKPTSIWITCRSWRSIRALTTLTIRSTKRPNYHFGQWDPHQIDNRGFYTRYIVQQVTLDALMDRLNEEPDTPRDQLIFEAAAVLAGTIIMSTGISGTGPGTPQFDNQPVRPSAKDRQLSRRVFICVCSIDWMARTENACGKRPPNGDSRFGGARQHLNAALARRRASQLEHVHLAAIFARMGYIEQANTEANIVPAASARMLCQIDCRITAGDLAVAKGDLDVAVHLLREIMDWVRRGIECGAIIDPWNILGFDANFSLFPALENSVRDHRADELVTLMEQVFALYSKTWSEAAAKDEQALCRDVAQQFHETAEWWRKFAAHEVSSVEAVDVDDAFNAAAHVADALNLWHKGGAAVEDVAFWSPHADIFNSPKAFALVIDALLERRDFVASMALLIYWLGQAETHRIGERRHLVFRDRRKLDAGTAADGERQRRCERGVLCVAAGTQVLGLPRGKRGAILACPTVRIGRSRAVRRRS